MKDDIKKYYKLTIGIILLETLVTLSTIYLYQVIDDLFIQKILQNVSYFIMLFFVFIAIKISGKSLREFGLFSNALPKQIGIGLVGGLILLLVLKGFSFWPLSFDAYLVLSQILVVFAEEMLFRGFLFTMIYEISQSKWKAIVCSSILFALFHVPIGYNMISVLGTCMIGLVYSGIRSLYFKTDKEIGILPLAIFHWIYNIC